MYLPHLLRAMWPMIIGAIVVLVATLVFTNILVPGFGVLRDHPWIRRLIPLAALTYPLICWALFSWASHHDDRVAAELRAYGTPASATVTAVRDLGVDINTRVLLELGLRVAPPEAEPFDAEVFVKPSRLNMHAVRSGMPVRVRYDPKDRSRIVMDE